MVEVSRRTLLLAASTALRAQTSNRFVKSICSVVFPADMPLAEAFRRAKDAGFQAFEIQMNKQLTPATTPDEVRRIRAGARGSRSADRLHMAVGIHSQQSPQQSRRRGARARHRRH